MNIGEKIRTYRRNCKLTQKELGEKIGVSDKTISSWENSRTILTQKDTIFLSARLLFGLSFSYQLSIQK